MALYDPREFPETKVGTDFTLADVLAWARTKPADERYDFTSSQKCAFAQFGLATGRDKLIGPSGSHVLREMGWEDAFSLETTFGGLVKQLEALS